MSGQRHLYLILHQALLLAAPKVLLMSRAAKPKASVTHLSAINGTLLGPGRCNTPIIGIASDQGTGRRPTLSSVWPFAHLIVARSPTCSPRNTCVVQLIDISWGTVHVWQTSSQSHAQTMKCRLCVYHHAMISMAWLQADALRDQCPPLIHLYHRVTECYLHSNQNYLLCTY